MDISTVVRIITLIEPFLIKLIDLGVKKYKTNIYKHLADKAQTAVESLIKLKQKIKESPSELDNKCFSEGLNIIKTLNSWLVDRIKELEIV
jgi:hypothetical protein